MGGYYSNFLGETSMGDYVPGTGSDSSFGKTYAEVFAPNVAAVLKWVFRIGVGLSVLAWIGGTLRDVAFNGLASWFMLWATGRVALAVYLAGVKAGIEYEKQG